MSRTTRTFIAIGVPEDRAAKLSRLQTLIAAEVVGVRWVDPQQFHATLAFLGDVDDTELNRVCRAVAEVVAGFGPFELSLEGLGTFPGPTRPRNFWVGLTGPGVEVLTELQKAVTDAVAAVGYPSQDDRFVPHVTLGRLKTKRGQEVDVSALTQHYRRWMGGPIRVSEVVCYSSTLTADGPSYTPLARAPLEGRKPERRP
jgi:2'-5' RNA ligase